MLAVQSFLLEQINLVHHLLLRHVFWHSLGRILWSLVIALVIWLDVQKFMISLWVKCIFINLINLLLNFELDCIRVLFYRIKYFKRLVLRLRHACIMKSTNIVSSLSMIWSHIKRVIQESDGRFLRPFSLLSMCVFLILWRSLIVNLHSLLRSSSVCECLFLIYWSL